jgi:hypothetical protein
MLGSRLQTNECTVMMLLLMMMHGYHIFKTTADWSVTGTTVVVGDDTDAVCNSTNWNPMISSSKQKSQISLWSIETTIDKLE